MHGGCKTSRLMMMVMLILVHLLVSVPQVIRAQAPYLGACPEPPVEEVFQVEQFLGKWFEVERTFALFEATLKCVSVEYYLREDGKIGLRNTGVNSLGQEETISGFVITPDAYHPGRMIVFVSGFPIPVNLTILHTDYKNFAVLWSCKELLGGILGHTENMWILSRKPYLDETTKEVIYQFLVSTGVGLKGLKVVEQIDCPHRKIPLPPLDDHQNHDEEFLSRHPAGGSNHDDPTDDPAYGDYRRKTGDRLPEASTSRNSTGVRFLEASTSRNSTGVNFRLPESEGASSPSRKKSGLRSTDPDDRKNKRTRSGRKEKVTFVGRSTIRNNATEVQEDDGENEKAASESAYVRFRQLPTPRFFRFF